jgi:hypothetical protein
VGLRERAPDRPLRPGAAARVAAVLLAPLLFPGAAAGQGKVSLEALVRAMEGRLGVHARNLTTGREVALNADKPFAIAAIEPAILPNLESRPGAASRPSGITPRALADAVARLHRECPHDLGDPVRRAFLTKAHSALTVAGLSPTVEVGTVSTGRSRAPAVAGYAASTAGDMIFAVVAENLESAYTADFVFAEIVEACFARLVPGNVESPSAKPVESLVLASLHEARQDAKLFPETPQPELADARRGAQKLSFGAGDTARLAVLARPAEACRVTVQWWSPAERAHARETRILDGRALGDAVFDCQLTALGLWRVRVALGDAIVLDEKFYVTRK